MLIKLKRLRADAILPRYATPGAAGCDVSSCANVTLHPGQSSLIPLGFSMEIPKGFAAVLMPRSGLGTKKGIVLGNLIGLIDSDYRGEVHACVWNRNQDGEAYVVTQGERIAQMTIIPVVQSEFVVADELEDTERGTGGFGSTGS